MKQIIFSIMAALLLSGFFVVQIAFAQTTGQGNDKGNGNAGVPGPGGKPGLNGNGTLGLPGRNGTSISGTNNSY
jgi:hypothetical protein